MHTQLQGIESILKWSRLSITETNSQLDFTLFGHQLQSNAMAVNLMYRQLVMKTFVQDRFWQNRKF